MHGLCIDQFDLRLLDVLQRDGRLTNQELADHVGLSASQCSRRRVALEQASIIEGYRAILSSKQVGVDLMVFVEISLSAHSPDIARSLFTLFDQREEIQEAYSLSGGADYLLKLTITDLRALSHIVNDMLLPHASVAHIRTFIVLDRLKQSTGLPLGHLR